MNHFTSIIDFWKAAGHLYRRRIPYINKQGKRRYRYFYNDQHLHGHTLGAIAEILIGSSYEYTETDGTRGHVHVKEIRSDGSLVVVHDETQKKRIFKDKAAFSRWIREHHAEGIKESKEKFFNRLRRERKNKSISLKRTERRAKFLGLSIPDFENKAPEGLILKTNDFSHLRYQIKLKDAAGRMMPKWVLEETAQRIVEEGFDSWVELQTKPQKKQRRQKEPEVKLRDLYENHKFHADRFEYPFEIPRGAIHPRDWKTNQGLVPYIRPRGTTRWRNLMSGEENWAMMLDSVPFQGSNISNLLHADRMMRPISKANAHLKEQEETPQHHTASFPVWKTMMYHLDELGFEVVFCDHEDRITSSIETGARRDAVSLSAGQPPNFTALDLSKFNIEKVVNNRGFTDYKLITNDPVLERLGFYDALGTANRRNFTFTLIAKVSEGGRLTPRMGEFLAKPITNLSNWWAGLNDDEREEFYHNYLDADQQNIGRLRDPRHENDNLEIPQGMEKMKAKGWNFHTYQKKAINFALTEKRVVWAMEMGLGKTLSAVGLFHHLKTQKEAKKMIVTAPLSAHGSWIQHLGELSDVRYEVLSGVSKKKRLKAYEKFEKGEIDVLVVSPEAVRKPKREGKGAGDFYHIEKLVSQDTLFIADEVHKFKGSESNQGKAFRELSKKAGRVVGMTGTPKPNKPMDFFNVMKGVNPDWVIDSWDFTDRYCLKVDGEPAAFNPAKLQEFHELNAEMLFIRSTGDPDAKLDLPDRIDISPSLQLDAAQKDLISRAIPYCNIKVLALLGSNAKYNATREQRAAMETVWRLDAEVSECIKDPAKFEAMSKEDQLDLIAYTTAVTGEDVFTIRLDQIAVSPRACGEKTAILLDMYDENYETPKMGVVADAAIEHVEQNPETGGVIFCEYVQGLKAAQRALIKRGVPADQIELYYGAVSPKKRREIERKLNEGEIKYVLGQTKALETGANLQKRANFVAHLNTPWSPDTLVQSTARVYRQGQRRKTTILRPTGSEIERIRDRVVTSKLSQTAQVTGATMVADEGAIRSTANQRKQAKDAASIADLLGIPAIKELKLNATGEEEPEEKPETPETVSYTNSALLPFLDTAAQKNKAKKGGDWVKDKFNNDPDKWIRMSEIKGQLNINENGIVESTDLNRKADAAFWAGVYAYAFRASKGVTE